MPYELELQIVGFFGVDASCEQELSRELAVVNGSSILFGTAREFLRNLTSSGPHPAIVLPAVSFTDPAGESGQQEKETK
jgi:preprotein translocase subunit SecB